MLLLIVYRMHVVLSSYVEKYDLKEPSDDIQHVLKRIAVKLRKTQRVKAITGVGKKVLIPHIPTHTAIYSVVNDLFL